MTLQVQQKGVQNTSGWKFLPPEPYGHKQITLWAAFINSFQICSSWSVGSFKTWLIYFLQPWKGGISWNPNAQHISLDLSNKATCLSLPSYTHALTEVTSWGEYWEAHRTDAQWSIGRRPGIPVAGVAPETEQNGARGKNIYNNPDENKMLGYYFILAAARTIKAVRGKDHSFSKTVLWKACNELLSPKNSVQVNIAYLNLWDGDPSLCPPDVTSLIIDNNMAFL